MSDFRKKKSMEFVLAAFNVSTETFWQKPSTFEESLNLCFFFILWSNVFPRGCRNYLIRVQGTFLRCSIGTISALNSDFEQKVFELLRIKFYHSSQNRIQYVGRINCGKFCSFWSSCSSIFFWPREKLFWHFWQKIINRFVRSVFCMSGGNFQEYQFSWEAIYLLVSFSLSVMVFRTFAEKNSVKFVKAAFNVWAGKVRREPFTYGKITTFFSSDFCRLFFHGVFETVCYVSRGNFWGDLLELFLLYVRSWARKYRTFVYKALPLLSKLHSIGWEDHLWRIQFFLQFFSSLIFFWPWETFCILTKLHWQGCWNCNPCFLRNWLRNTGFFFWRTFIYG